jgi:hypothetical protein
MNAIFKIGGRMEDIEVKLRIERKGRDQKKLWAKQWKEQIFGGQCERDAESISWLSIWKQTQFHPRTDRTDNCDNKIESFNPRR